MQELTAGPSLFQYFLGKLSEEHDREIAELRAQIGAPDGSARVLAGASHAAVAQPPAPQAPQPSVPGHIAETSPDSTGGLHRSQSQTSMSHMAAAKAARRVSALKGNRVSVLGPVAPMPGVVFCGDEPDSDEEPSTTRGGRRPDGSLIMEHRGSDESIASNVSPASGEEHEWKDSRRKYSLYDKEEWKDSHTIALQAKFLADFKLTGTVTDDVLIETYFKTWRSFATLMNTSYKSKLRQVWHPRETDDPSQPSCENPMALSQALSAWDRTPVADGNGVESQETGHRSVRASTHQPALSLDIPELSATRSSPSLVLHPNSLPRIMWDSIGALLILYDILTIPLMAFNPPSNVFTTIMDWFLVSFWTLDMVVSCCTGYLANGDTVMAWRSILRNYCRRWFLFDILINAPEWVFSIMKIIEGGASGEGVDAGSSRMLRTMRVLRFARVLRLAKLKAAIVIVTDRIESEETFILLNVFKLISMMLMVNHMLACAWYAIGVATTYGWVESGGYADTSIGYRYTTSMHWSLTQFVPASMEVVPVCVPERIYAIIVVVIGLVLFSSIVGKVTASLSHLQTKGEEKSKQFWLLRRYLRQQGIDPQLSFRVLRFIEHEVEQHKDLVSEQGIWVLSHLSSQLRDELNFEVNFRCLDNHPLFYHTMCFSDDFMNHLAATALCQQHLAPGDLLFNAGSEGSHMHMVVTGQLHYVKAEELRLENPLQESFIAGDWACEAALWIPWKCVGTSRTTELATLVQIDAEAYAKAVQREPAAWNIAAFYAQNYCNWVGRQRLHSLSDWFKHSPVENMNLIEGFLEGTSERTSGGKFRQLGSKTSTGSKGSESLWRQLRNSGKIRHSTGSSRNSRHSKRHSTSSARSSWFSKGSGVNRTSTNSQNVKRTSEHGQRDRLSKNSLLSPSVSMCSQNSNLSSSFSANLSASSVMSPAASAKTGGRTLEVIPRSGHSAPMVFPNTLE